MTGYSYKVPQSDRPPTRRQLQVLATVHKLLIDQKMPPTLREIGDALGISSKNGVNDHLNALVAKGLLLRKPMLSRAIWVTDAGALALEGKPQGRW